MTNISGTRFSDVIIVGTGAQVVDGGSGNDRIISYADAGEPDPAQTFGADGRVNPPVTTPTDDIFIGGSGADTFEFRALIDGKASVVAAHTGSSGVTNWGAVAGENDNVHDHWVNGFGMDTILDFSKEQRDKIKITGHTMTLDSITYGSDEGGEFSLITVYSQQGDGGAGGANTATGAHDEDPLGQIKVYGDKVEESDLIIQKNNEGVDRLYRTDEVFAPLNALVQNVVYSNTDETAFYGSIERQTDRVSLGEGSQYVDTGGGNDMIYSYSDGGEPDAAQTGGETGRQTAPVPEDQSFDVIKGGQGRDTFNFRLLLNATDEILEEHTRGDGSINWRGVAGENDAVHLHWVESIGTDVILDFSKQDKDKIDIRGHTVEIASITYDEDEGGDFSLIQLRSQQGDGGGAHDEDLLGQIKVYGDKVTEDDIRVKANVFYGVDELDKIAEAEESAPFNNEEPDIEQPQWGAPNPENIEVEFNGTSSSDTIKAGSGTQIVSGNNGNDRFISYGDAGEPDPAQTGGPGRVNPELPFEASDDYFTGGAGRDKFEFHALLNARAEVIAQHTGSNGAVNWRAVAGENDNVHDHWVEGFGYDTIFDFSLEDGDSILVRGHTVEIESVTYGSDEGGEYSKIHVISQQGDGGAGGANTETGAHDEDSLGYIKVYGDKITEDDIKVQAANVFDGVDRLREADKLGDQNGGVKEFESSTHNEEIVTAPEDIKTTDNVKIGSGAQLVSTGLNSDRIRVFSDGGEPDPAQTDGADGRIDPPIDGEFSSDEIWAGQSRDFVTFNYLLDATDVVLARHTREDGSINWRSVAGENEAVHDHWVQAGGDDIYWDFSKQDGDRIELRGHTVELAEITYGEDANGDFSVLHVRSQQGDGGGAHDEDLLGTVKVYGDVVTEDDVTVRAKGVFDGADIFEPFEDAPNLIYEDNENNVVFGTDGSDNIHGRNGEDFINGGDDNDFIFGGGHNDIMMGGDGNDWIEGSWGLDTMFGENGEDHLVSTSGRDIMWGGADADHFVFKDSSKGGQILDWQDGIDKIDFSRMDAVQSADDLGVEQVAPNAYEISFVNDAGKEGEVRVIGNAPFSLDAGDFAF
ncbi:MAG: calcium-binding protein [Rhodobacteraceae bacterium]|nr:calcium-binding protein [Paracoccaceae bacterium]